MTTPSQCSTPMQVLFLEDWSEIPRRSLAEYWFVAGGTSQVRESLLSTYANLIGERRLFQEMPKTSLRIVVEGLDRGLPTRTVRKVTELLGVNRQTLSRILDVSPRTLSRRQTLKTSVSERLFRVSALFQKTLEVLGDRDEARRWFATPKKALGGKSPMDYSESEIGAREVEDLLGRIEHGVYT